VCVNPLVCLLGEKGLGKEKFQIVYVCILKGASAAYGEE